MTKSYLVTKSQTFRVSASSPEAARMASYGPGRYEGVYGVGERGALTNTTTEVNEEEAV
jgi:hypothetical protein